MGFFGQHSPGQVHETDQVCLQADPHLAQKQPVGVRIHRQILQDAPKMLPFKGGCKW